MLAPIIVLLVAMLSLQVGAAAAKGLFATIGSAGATAWRLALGALVLLVVWRPWRMRPSWRDMRMLTLYGLAMGVMNLLFYLSLNRIPLGLAVAVEFTGPLALSMATSRRPVDFIWIVLAALGLVALLPIAHGAAPLDRIGVVYALAAGLCWALYIVSGQKAGSAHGGQATALGALIAAVVIVPIGIGHAGMALFAPSVIPAACVVGLMSSAIPFSLEMYALTRLPTRSFGVLMSIEPALGAMTGLIFLHEDLTMVQWAAIGCIMLASAGSAATSRQVPAILAD